MRKTFCSLVLAVATAGTSAQPAAELTGDAKLACEALLCLAASTRPAECAPSIRRYFSISYRRFSDTLRGRLNFLNMCPVISQPGMASLKNALVNGAGRCDAATLNRTTYSVDEGGAGSIPDTLPDHCAAYYGNQYVQGAVRYVGEPGAGGHWVEAKDYAAELAAYNAMRESTRSGRQSD